MLADSNTEFLMTAVRKHGGDKAVLAVQAAYGGLIIKIPVGGANLAKLLGEEIATAVSKDVHVSDADGKPIGNFKAYVPMGFKSRKSKLARQIGALREAGVPVQEIAVRVNCCERTVGRHIAGTKQPDTLIRKREEAKWVREKVVEYAKAGADISTICTATKRSESVVRGYLRRAGVRLIGNKFKSAELELRSRIHALRAEGLSYSQIGNRLGVSPGKVGYHVHRPSA